MNKLTTILAVSTIAFVSLQSSDAEADVPYGPAGCGLGHMVVGPDLALSRSLLDDERRIHNQTSVSQRYFG